MNSRQWAGRLVPENSPQLSAGRARRKRRRRGGGRSMPNNQALQVFYGTVPLILILLGIWFREQMLLKDILERLRNIEATLGRTNERLAALETRAGIIYHN